MKRFIRGRSAKFIWPIGLLVVMTGGVATTAAGAAEDEAAPATCEGQDETDLSEPSASEAGHHHHESFGPMALIAEGLKKTCLSDDQRTAIEQLGKDVSEKEKAVHEAHHALRAALVEQLKSGAIDESALQDEVDALVKAREDASPTFRKALEDLHDILDSGQRARLADTIEGRIKDMAKASDGWLDKFETDMALSDDQKSRVKDVLDKAKPQLAEERKGAEAAFEAFKSDDFSMEKILPESKVGERTRDRAERMIDRAKELVAILTPEQREELAKKIDAAMSEHVGTTQQSHDSQLGLIVGGGGFHAGAVSSWGGGGMSMSHTSVRTGYSTGFPLVGGYSPGIW